MKNLSKRQQQALSHLPMERLNKMQKDFIALNRRYGNVMLQAPTGSGKTLAFLFSILDKVENDVADIQVLIIVPSRELAVQIEEVFRSLKTGIKVNAVYGGHKLKTEVNNFSEPPAILIGTPGRLEDHLNRKHFNTEKIHTLVIDEFDKILELGFEEELKHIVRKLPHIQNKVLVSATVLESFPPYLKFTDYKALNITKESKRLKLYEVRANENDKMEALIALLKEVGNAPTLVFCNHREAAERIGRLLHKNNIPQSIFHGGLTQNERERALVKLRNGSSNVFITTDLASRGLDVPEIKNIIHYQLPTDETAYIHRNGRTARMNKEGTAYLVLSEEELLPLYIKENINSKSLEEGNTEELTTSWETIYIGGGKKDKINKIDIVGFFIKKGKIAKEDLGKIEVFDNKAYVAVRRGRATDVVKRIRREKIKKQRVKIALSK